MFNPNYSGPERRTIDIERTELQLQDHAKRAVEGRFTSQYAAEGGKILKSGEGLSTAMFTEGEKMREAVIERIFAQHVEWLDSVIPGWSFDPYEAWQY
jgi:hypothetical protein